MSVLDKILEIYKKYYICSHCLGRMFALLGTNTTNFERGGSLLLSLLIDNHANYLSHDKKLESNAIDNLKILAEYANFIPAQKVLEYEGIEYKKFSNEKVCHLCRDIFNNLEKYEKRAKELIEDINFNNFLVGTTPDSQIINNEDIFKAELNLLNSESFKSHFNRVIGKMLTNELNKSANFENPEIVFVYKINYNEFSVELKIKSIFIAGKYNKFIRGIPQTKWICKKCLGTGCELCNYTGKKYETSIQELISPEFVKESMASDTKFHGAGREDIDVRMLGSGRPFILELKNPKIRRLNLDKIQELTNKIQTEKVRINDLRYSDKNEVIQIKMNAENTRKSYKVLVQTDKDLDLTEFNNKVIVLKNRLENQKISQRTPTRVSHRRADLIREKTIFNIKEKYIEPKLFEFVIETQGGTYIKELVSGDNARTTPSFSEIFGVPLTCKELDVINIEK